MRHKEGTGSNEGSEKQVEFDIRTGEEPEEGVEFSLEVEQSRETEEAIRSLRDFVHETLPFLDSRILDLMDSQSLIPLLKKYWNEPASWEAFSELIAAHGKQLPNIDLDDLDPTTIDDPENPLHTTYIQYLMNKLPIQLQERWEDVYDTAVTDGSSDALRIFIKKLLSATSRKDSGLNFALHTSTHDFGTALPGETFVQPVRSNDTFVDAEGNQRHDDTAKTWYSIDERNLYKDARKGQPRFLYIVEASRGDIISPRFYAKDKGAFFTHGRLPVRAKIPLGDANTDDRERERLLGSLGIGFSEFGTV